MNMTMKPREAEKALRAAGFVEVRHNGTSHKIFKKDGKLVPVPMHPKDLSPKVENIIKKAAGLK